MSQHQPGPYGDGPNPYARSGPAPGQDGFSVPQQPGPYSQAPYPGAASPGPGFPAGPADHGAPGAAGPHPPPPGKPGRGARTGIAAAVLVAAAAAGSGLAVLLSGGGAVSDDGRKYTLRAPESAAGLTAEFTGDTSELAREDSEAMGVRREGGVSALYSGGSGTPEVGFAYFTGEWGTVEDPGAAVDAFFARGAGQLTEDDASAELIGEPEPAGPEGLGNAVMKCQMLQDSDAAEGEPDQAPVCVWSDYDTVGVVVGYGSEEGDGAGRGHPEPPSLESTAAFAAELRDAALVDEGPDGEGTPEGGAEDSTRGESGS